MGFLKNLFASEEEKNIAALHDPRAKVRHAAAGFFLEQARTGRPVLSALPDLVRVLTKEYPATLKSARTTEEMLEMSARVGFRRVVGLAIMATIGAQRLGIGWENPNLEGFRIDCRQLATEAEDQIIQQDAKLYLKHLFRE